MTALILLSLVRCDWGEPIGKGWKVFLVLYQNHIDRVKSTDYELLVNVSRRWRRVRYQMALFGQSPKATEKIETIQKKWHLRDHVPVVYYPKPYHYARARWVVALCRNNRIKLLEFFGERRFLTEDVKDALGIPRFGR